MLLSTSTICGLCTHFRFTVLLESTVPRFCRFFFCFQDIDCLLTYSQVFLKHFLKSTNWWLCNFASIIHHWLLLFVPMDMQTVMYNNQSWFYKWIFSSIAHGSAGYFQIDCSWLYFMRFLWTLSSAVVIFTSSELLVTRFRREVSIKSCI